MYRITKPLNRKIKAVKKLFLYSFIILITSFCQKNDKPKLYGTVKKIEPNIEHSNALNLNKLNIKPTLIELETLNNSLIGEIKAVKFLRSEKIFIADTRDELRILIFKFDGSFYKEFNMSGRGPGEYSKIDDFQVRGDSVLQILDGRLKTIYSYNFFNNNFIESKEIPFYAYKFEYIEDELGFIFYKNEKANNFENENNFYDLILTDKNLRTLDSKIPFYLVKGKSHFSISRNQVFSESNGVIYYSDMNTDSIYSISNSGITTSYHIDYGGKKIDLSSITFSSAIEKMRYLYENSEDKIPMTLYVFSSKNKIWISFPFNNQLYLSAYDIAEDSTITYDKIEHSSFLDGSLPVPKFIDGGLFVSIIDENFADHLLKANTELKEKNKITSIINGNSNPILILFNANDIK